MKKLIKEVGLSTLISMATGTKGVGATRELAKTISSSAFDRSLEKDADLKSVEYMAKAEVNPAPFAEFMYKLSSNENLDMNNYLSWMSTHPASEDRAAYIMDYASEFKGDYHSVLSEATWQKVQRLVGKEEE
jgi:beta-barrel assembly-enhancing protease